MLQECQVAGLLLDEANPRFVQGKADSQRAAINSLLADAPGKLLNLARDIVTQGSLNPTELPVVVNEDDSLVVIEGNRRLAALKLLSTPGLADDAEQVNRFTQLSAEGTLPTSLTCYVAESREAARHWLRLRHTGENDGIGVLEWNAEQQNNFHRRRGSQADWAVLFCDAVARDFPDEAELLSNIATVRRTRLTTLGRLIGDPDVRQDIGFGIADGEPTFTYESTALLRVMRQLFSDFAGSFSVARIMNKELRRGYLRDLAEHLPPPEARLPQARPPGQSSAAATLNSSAASPDSKIDAGEDRAKSESTGPTPRRTLPKEEPVIFYGLRFRGFDLRTSRLLAQAQAIGIDHLPAVSGVMLRVVVECAVTEVAVKYNWAEEGDSLKSKLRKVLLRLDPDIERPRKGDIELELAWTRSQSDNGLGIRTMNGFVHSFFAHPAPQEVRALSTAFRPVLVRLDSYLIEHPA